MLKTFPKLYLLGGIVLGFSFSCASSGNLANTPCETSLDCPAGQACSPTGYCEALLGATGNQSSSSGSGSSQESGSGSSSNSGGSYTPSSSSSSSSGSTSSSTYTFGGSSSSSSGSSSSSSSSQAACGCSSSCCSEQATASSTKNSGGLTCPDGTYCYGSYYCSLAANGGCSSSDPCNGNSGTYTSCSSSSSGSSSSGSSSSTVSGSSSSSGTLPTGSVGPTGGSVSSLDFAIVGDTRPQNEDDTSSYPIQNITDIYQNIVATSPIPQFVMGTGDYAFCSGSDCATQTGYYITAAQQYYPAHGQIFLAMGNHECATDAATAGNCASDNYQDGVSGITPNYTNFFNMLNTFGINSTTQSTLSSGNPYYSFNVNSSDSTNPWTAKFVMIAANAWDSAQESWLTSTLAQSTTYTFVIRHEPDGTSGYPGSDSEAIVNASSFTMMFVGHTHEYSQTNTNNGQVELIIGNGGAQTSGPAGYVICNMVTGGNISCQPYAAGTTSSTNGSAVVVNAAGAVQ